MDSWIYAFFTIGYVILLLMGFYRTNQTECKTLIYRIHCTADCAGNRDGNKGRKIESGRKIWCTTLRECRIWRPAAHGVHYYYPIAGCGFLYFKAAALDLDACRGGYHDGRKRHSSGVEQHGCNQCVRAYSAD